MSAPDRPDPSSLRHGPARPIHQTVAHRSGRETEYSFPTYQTLAEHFVEIGRIGSPDDLLDPANQDALGDLFLAWTQWGQHSCQFARRLARHRPSEWHILAFPKIGEALPHLLNQALGAAADDAEGFVALFPGVATPPEIAELIRVLCSDPAWCCTSVPGRYPDQLLLSLRWRLPDGEHESWVLGFAPVETMPFTRRIEGAPFSALVLRHRWPPSNHHPEFGYHDKREVHLANMPLDPGALTVERLWHKTKRLRRAFLGEDVDEAKARVTFRLPADVRGRLPGAEDPSR